MAHKKLMKMIILQKQLKFNENKKSKL